MLITLSINRMVSLSVLAYLWGSYLRNFMLLNNLRKVAKGNTNKAYTSISKIPTLTKFSEIQKYLTPMFLILVQIQQKNIHIKNFCFIVSAECFYHGSDWNITVCVASVSLQSAVVVIVLKLPRYKLAQSYERRDLGCSCHAVRSFFSVDIE